MSEENIENITKSDCSFEPILSGNCLINNNICITKKVINLYISYILNSQLRCLKTDFTLDNCLFGSVKLTKNADLDKLNIAATA